MNAGAQGRAVFPARPRPFPRPLFLFLFAFLLRAALNFYFFLSSGWFSSNLIEIWFYYGVAQGAFPLSPLDPTRWLLKLLFVLVPAGALYQAIAFSGALLSAGTAVLVYLWIRRSASEKAGVWAGLIMAVLPSSLTLCLANFSHDLVQLPMVVLFWLALTVASRASARTPRLGAALAAAILAVLGIAVGPLMAAAVIGFLFYLVWLAFRAACSGKPSGRAVAVFTAALVLVNAVLYLVMNEHLLRVLAPLAVKMRGIDLAAQVAITVGDLQPLPPESLWNRYNLFLFFIPWGLWIAYRRRDFFLLPLFFFALALSLAVNRGTRLLDPIIAALIAPGWANWSWNGLKATAGTMIAILGMNLIPASIWNIPGTLRLDIPLRSALALFTDFRRLFSGPAPLRQHVLIALLIVAFLALAVAWLFSLRSRRRWLAPLLFILTLAGEAGWVLISAAQPASEQLEYEAYRILDERSRPGEKIFAAWNQGFFIPSVTHLTPITTPDRIDIPLTALYWADETEAYEELKRRGVTYVHVNSRYFGLTGVDPVRDSYSMRGNTIIGPRPDHIRTFSRMRKTFLYRLNYEPETLRLFRMIYDAFDPDRQIGVRIFALN
ncbi:MAG: glycosyltransferase family 39 protein [Candidatus Aureabacteria bacterium]|nr:glycosyltransferase family 39 protein [Candidatus Auribacterota bacterium]